MINLKKQTDLTERQQNLIDELHQEFIKINQSRIAEDNSLFSTVVLQQRIEVDLQMSEERAREKTIMLEIISQFESDVSILTKEFNKLGIPVSVEPLKIVNERELRGGKLTIGDYQFTSDTFQIEIIPLRERKTIYGTTYTVYKPGINYELYRSANYHYDGLSFTQNEHFIYRVGRLHKIYNK